MRLRCNAEDEEPDDSYFHTGTRTIIGVEAFHGPVRDGKEWDHLAMVIRHKGGVVVGVKAITTNLGKK